MGHGLGAQLFALRDIFAQLGRVFVPGVEKFLGRYAEVVADMKQRVQRGQHFAVFNIIDVIFRLAQRQRHISSRYAPLRSELYQTRGNKILVDHAMLTSFTYIVYIAGTEYS